MVDRTFDKSQEQLRKKTRGGSKLLPPTLYRVFYEGSATLSSRVSKDTHVRHRENKQLKLRNGNAFQTIGEVVFNKSVTKEGIERHLVWNKKKDPSTWISMFHGFGKSPFPLQTVLSDRYRSCNKTSKVPLHREQKDWPTCYHRRNQHFRSCRSYSPCELQDSLGDYEDDRTLDEASPLQCYDSSGRDTSLGESLCAPR